ncbi:MAG: type II toxin-antitoxin system VapC family toxin [Tepidiformaceae bacterium]|jgi:predicted nucleic acid-binding protein
MPSIAIVDSGPLIAALDRNDPDHARCLRVLQEYSGRLVIPALCVAEVTHFAGRRMGPAVEADFIAALPTMEIECPASEDWGRMAELVRLYADWPLGTVDASVITLSERLGTDTIVTLDERHFRAVRPGHVPQFTLLPSDARAG